MKLRILTTLMFSFLAACGQMGQSSFSASNASLDNANLDNGSASDIETPDYLEDLQRLSKSQIQNLLDIHIPQIHRDGGDNRYSTALFATAREMAANDQLIVPYQTLQIPTSFLKNGTEKLPVQFHRSRNEKAPLMIILNPLYSGEFAHQMSRYLNYFGAREYHVLVFMNPWSPDIINRSPNFMPGDVWIEAEMHLQAIDYIIQHHLGGRSQVLGATLLGFSYGAFLSSVVKAYDQKRAQPLINGPTLLLSPPHDIFKSLRNLDRQVASVTAMNHVNCLLSGGFVGIVKQSATITDYNQTNLNENCAKFLFVDLGFNTTLKSAVTKMNSSKSLGLTTTQIANMTYEKYMNDVAGLKPTDAETDIGYWMSESKRMGYDKFNVVMSVDDNINENNSLAVNGYYDFSQASVVQLPTGGHGGFREAKSRDKTCGPDWTACMLKALYP